MINRFRGTLDTWDPAFLDALASRYNVITIDYSGTGLSTGTCAADVLSMAKDVKDVLFFEPKSETSKNAGLLSFGRIAKRTEDLDTFVSMECYDNQRKAIEDFREDKYDILGKLKSCKIPILVFIGDHDICFHVEDWYPLVEKLPSIQLVVMPQAGHGVQHQYPELAAKYITAFIDSSLS